MTVQRQPVIRGDRVVLRPWANIDVGCIEEASADEKITLFTSVPSTQERQPALDYISRQNQRFTSGMGWSFAITPHVDRESVGFVGCFWEDQSQGRASIGYWLRASCRGTGTCASAVTTLSTWAFEHTGIERLSAYIDPQNLASIRVAQRAEFHHEGLLRSFMRLGDRRQDMLLYARVRA